eukprot:1160989-Pelagomonas_calceolata.AAC.12
MASCRGRPRPVIPLTRASASYPHKNEGQQGMEGTQCCQAACSAGQAQHSAAGKHPACRHSQHTSTHAESELPALH